jgi:hypothetical protein
VHNVASKDAVVSDGAPHATAFAEPAGDSAPYETRDRNRPDLDIAAFVEWLPRLGTVLWLHRPTRDAVFPRARLTDRGVLLLEHPDLTAIADATAIRSRSAVTSHGPPDTDYLAWDSMRAVLDGDRAPAESNGRWQAHGTFMRCAFARARSAWHARVVRMPLLRLPCLHVLGVRDADALSSLGRQLAVAIVGDEYARMA